MNTTANILLVDDDPAFRHVMASELRRLGHTVTAAASGEEAVRITPELEPEVILLDLRLPGIDGLATLQAIREHNPSIEIVMLTGHGSIDTAIESIRMGAFDYVVKPCPLDELQIRIQRALERRALHQRANLLERGLTPPDLAGSFIGESPEFQRLMHLIDRVAPGNSTVLIAGETGSGKERVAKLIHSRSPRRLKPFVVVDCAVLQETLMASELFGYERGAFTGADRSKPGLFEVAHGGTIFLDEIGEVSPAIQTKLLRVLDTSAFRRVGGNAEVHVDVRILAATNRDLRVMVRQGQFREDLYYRMSTIMVEVPPLRSRGADIALLARHFLDVLNERFQCSRRIGDAALEVCRRHSWPGNVRELMHAIESAMVLCEGPEILPEHLPPTIWPGTVATPAASAGAVPTLDELERSHIRRVLETCNGHRENAARILGISERNLYRKIHELGL
jgi:DNA-binding NtrC family response regulator